MSAEEEVKRVEWFNGLKPGDEVRYYSWGRSIEKIVKVKNRTPGGKIRLENAQLFDKNCCNYNRVGFGSSYRIGPITGEFIMEQEHKQLALHFGSVKWGELPLETLREVQSILDRPKGLKEFSVETNQTASEGELLEGTIYRDETTRDKARIFAHRILEAVPHEGENYEHAMTVKVLGEEVR